MSYDPILDTFCYLSIFELFIIFLSKFSIIGILKFWIIFGFFYFLIFCDSKTVHLTLYTNCFAISLDFKRITQIIGYKKLLLLRTQLFLFISRNSEYGNSLIHRQDTISSKVAITVYFSIEFISAREIEIIVSTLGHIVSILKITVYSFRLECISFFVYTQKVAKMQVLRIFSFRYAADVTSRRYMTQPINL